MKENADKVRALDTAELRKQLGESSEQMFRLRFQMSMGQTDGLKKLRLLRRERARMLTVLRERELNPDNAAPVKPVKKTKAAAKAKAAVKPERKAAPVKAAKKAGVKKPAAANAPAKKTAAKTKGKG
jgi:large subunit ribosomal protein L29